MCGSLPPRHKILGQRLNQSQGFDPESKAGVSITVMKCRDCGLIFSNPQPVPFDIQDHYGLPPENYWETEYFKINENYFDHQIATTKKLSQFKEGMKALDIGAGLGKCMISLKSAGYDVYGVEPSVPFYQKAIEKMNISSDKLKLGMIEEIDYPDNFFDFITFGAVFEHLYHPAVCLEKAMRWLKPNGIIHIEVPSSRHFIAKIYNTYYRLKGTNYVTHLSPMHVPFHLYEFTLKSFQELSKKLKYKIVAHEYNVCEIMHIPKLFHPLLRKYMKWTKTGMQLTVYLEV